jgi:hypothetical protein
LLARRREADHLDDEAISFSCDGRLDGRSRSVLPRVRQCLLDDAIDGSGERRSNGITVTLLWSRTTNLVTVAVADAANDDSFELVLDEHEPALEVFNHPSAHAAARGLDFRTRRPEPEMLREAALARLSIEAAHS